MSTSTSRTPHHFAKQLALFIRDQADWRWAQARRFPDDERNARAAEGLEALATYVQGLPRTDRQLIQLEELDAFADDGTFLAGPNARRCVARYRFEWDEDEPRDLLRALVVAVAEDRRLKRAGDVGDVDERRGHMTVVLDRTRELGLRERELLADLLQLAASHDTQCENARLSIGRELALCGGPEGATGRMVTVDRLYAEEALMNYASAFAELAAAIAPAALLRLELLSSFGAEAEPFTDAIANMAPLARERLLRPLFEDAGIADRFLLTQEQLRLHEVESDTERRQDEPSRTMRPDG